MSPFFTIYQGNENGENEEDGFAVVGKYKKDRIQNLDPGSILPTSTSMATASATSTSTSTSDIPHELDRPLECAKDFKGRYYYEKFKILPGTNASKLFFSKLKESYLQGLMWCLAYYVKGCISWTWYFPYHYGPMLQV